MITALKKIDRFYIQLLMIINEMDDTFAPLAAVWVLHLIVSVIFFSENLMYKTYIMSGKWRFIVSVFVQIYTLIILINSMSDINEIEEKASSQIQKVCVNHTERNTINLYQNLLIKFHTSPVHLTIGKFLSSQKVSLSHVLVVYAHI